MCVCRRSFRCVCLCMKSGKGDVKTELQKERSRECKEIKKKYRPTSGLELQTRMILIRVYSKIKQSVNTKKKIDRNVHNYRSCA